VNSEAVYKFPMIAVAIRVGPEFELSTKVIITGAFPPFPHHWYADFFQ